MAKRKVDIFVDENILEEFDRHVDEINRSFGFPFTNRSREIEKDMMKRSRKKENSFRSLF